MLLFYLYRNIVCVSRMVGYSCTVLWGYFQYHGQLSVFLFRPQCAHVTLRHSSSLTSLTLSIDKNFGADRTPSLRYAAVPR